MKRLTFATGLTLFAITLTAGVAMARSGENAGKMNFETLDTNNDGQITVSEMSAFRTALLQQADADGDGMISVAELEAEADERTSRRISRMMERLDADSDGALSGEELAAQARMPRHFQRADENGDGALNKAEFDSAREKMSRHHRAGE